MTMLVSAIVDIPTILFVHACYIFPPLLTLTGKVKRQCVAPWGTLREVTRHLKEPFSPCLQQAQSLHYTQPAQLPGHRDAHLLSGVQEDLADVTLLLREDNLPLGHVPVQHIARLHRHGVGSLLIDQGVRDNSGVGEGKLEFAGHYVPDSDTVSRHYRGNLSSGGDTDGLYRHAVFVDVPLFLKDVVKVPDLDAPVDGGSEDEVVRADHQGLDLDDPLEVSAHLLDQVTGLHVPAQQLIPGDQADVKGRQLEGEAYFHLMPVTASLSPADRMMLLLWLNFFMMFLTPCGRLRCWLLPSSTCHSLKPLSRVAQIQSSFLGGRHGQDLSAVLLLGQCQHDYVVQVCFIGFSFLPAAQLIKAVERNRAKYCEIVHSSPVHGHSEVFRTVAQEGKALAGGQGCHSNTLSIHKQTNHCTMYLTLHSFSQKLCSAIIDLNT